MIKIYIETTKLYFISLNHKTHYNLITNIIIFLHSILIAFLMVGGVLFKGDRKQLFSSQGTLHFSP